MSDAGFCAAQSLDDDRWAILSFSAGTPALGSTIETGYAIANDGPTLFANCRTGAMLVADIHLFPSSETEALRFLEAPLFGGGILWI